MLNWQQNLHRDFPQRWKVKSSQLWMTDNHIITKSETDMLLFFKHLALWTQILRTHRKGLRTLLYGCTSEMDECKNMEMPKKGLKWEMTGILHLHEAEQTHNPHHPPPPTAHNTHLSVYQLLLVYFSPRSKVLLYLVIFYLCILYLQQLSLVTILPTKPI